MEKTIYSSLSKQAKNSFIESLVSPNLVYLNDKNLNVEFNHNIYETAFEKVINNYLEGHTAENIGNKNYCFDILVTKANTMTNTAIQMKAATIDNNYVKIYEQSCSVPDLDGVTDAKTILDRIIEIYNKRLQREQDRHHFSSLETLFLVKAENSVLIYDNKVSLDKFERDEVVEDSINLKTELNKDGDEVSRCLYFDYKGNHYKFTLNNHTLNIEFKATSQMDDYIVTDELKTLSEKLDEIIENAYNNYDSKKEKKSLPIGVAYQLARNDYLENNDSLKDLASFSTTNTENIVFNDEDIKSINNTLRYVNINEPGNKFAYALKNSTISTTGKMYKELLQLKAVNKKGKVLKNLRFKNRKEMKEFLL